MNDTNPEFRRCGAPAPSTAADSCAESGACLALPAFEAMLPKVVRARPRAPRDWACRRPAAPLRMAFVYFPNGAAGRLLVADGRAETDFATRPHAAAARKVQDHVQVSAASTIATPRPGPDGAATMPARNGTFLTGVRVRQDGRADIHAGISIDQVSGRSRSAT